MKAYPFFPVLLIGFLTLLSSCGPSCKACSVKTVSDQYENGQFINSSTATVEETRCDDLLEMVEENPVITTEAEIGTTKIIATTTYECQ